MKVYCPKCGSVIDTEDDPKSIGDEPEFAFCRNEDCLEVINLKYDKLSPANGNAPAPVTRIPAPPNSSKKEVPPGHCIRCGKGLGIVRKIKGRNLCPVCEKIYAKEAEIEKRNYLAGLMAGKLPILNAPLALSPKEECHLAEESKLYSEVTRRSGRGSGFSIRVMKGVYYHVGGWGSQSEIKIEEIDTGMLYITNMKTYFIGKRKTISIPHKKVLNYTTYTDAFQLNFDGSKKPLIFGVKDVPEATAILEGVLRSY